MQRLTYGELRVRLGLSRPRHVGPAGLADRGGIGAIPLLDIGGMRADPQPVPVAGLNRLEKDLTGS